jgi:hypothetical protein
MRYCSCHLASRISYISPQQGPTDDSCWAIRDRLLFGKIPWGKAMEKTSATSISCILLAGIDLFVSLMSEQEERECTERLNIKSIESQIYTAHASAKFAAHQLMHENTKIVEEQTKILARIPNFAKVDPRYMQSHREKLRSKSRIRLASDILHKAEKQLGKLEMGKKHDWIRLPLPVDSVPSVHDMLPIIWELERHLAMGRCIYLYSHEGHGRVGLVAGCLLGRLYSLTSFETLYRIQASHDSMKSEESRPVPVNCPQLPIQRKLIGDILNATSRVMDGVIWRTHTDPDTNIEEPRHWKRGSQEGVEAAAMVIEEAVPRGKAPVHFDYHVERDVPRPPPNTIGRGDGDDLDLEQLYGGVRLGQMTDIVRQLPLKRTDPAPDAKLPHIRADREGL